MGDPISLSVPRGRPYDCLTLIVSHFIYICGTTFSVFFHIVKEQSGYFQGVAIFNPLPTVED
jgi:hypothetical protein